MRDLYRALGLPGIVTHLPTLEGALGAGRVDAEDREDARFVLLNPARKARYDALLARAWALSEARARLGLPRDPQLPGPISPRRIPRERAGPGAEAGPRPVWMVPVGLGGVALLAALAWTGFRSGPPRDLGASPPLAGQPEGGGPATSPPPPEPDAVPPPGHGWVRMSPDTHPCVPWHIDTEPGQDYELSLHVAGTGQTALTVYLRGGEPFRGLAPEGAFEVSFSAGTRWLGPGRGFVGSGAGIRPAQVYRVQAGPDDSWVWRLRLHPKGCEGSPVAPPLAAPQGELL